MATSIGNLAIVISGNAKPFNNTLKSVQNTINQFQGGQNIINMRPPSGGRAGGSMGLQWGSFGRLARSAMVAGFGGGLAGALVGVGAMAFGQVLESTLHVVGAIGHQAAMFLADSFQEGLKVSRMEQGVNFLAGNGDRGASWMKEIRSLSAASGFEMVSLGQSMRTLAGSTDDLGSVVPTLRAIAEISAGIGAESEQMNRFALAVAQVTAAGRFEAQELNQLTEAGMPIKELAKTAEMSVGRFRAAVKDGEVSVSVLAQTFNRMVGPGGRFFGMLDERSKTAVGQFDKMAASWMMVKQELGRGLLDGLKDTGILKVIQSGIDYLLANKGEVKNFFNGITDDVKSLSIEFARMAGNIYDAAQAMVLFYKETKDVQEDMVKVLKYIPLPMHQLAMSAATPGGTARSAIESFSFGTGEDMANRMRRAFEGVKPAVADAFKPMHIALEMAPRLQKMLDGVRDRMKEGATPFDKFQNGMKSIEEIKKFSAKKAEDFYGTTSAPLTDDFGNKLNAFQRGMIEAEMFLDRMMKLPVIRPGEEDRMLYDQFKELEKGMTAAVDRFPAAMSAGSQEAISAVNHAMYGGGDKKTAQERVEAVLKEMKKNSDDEKADVKFIADSMRAWKGLPVKK